MKDTKDAVKDLAGTIKNPLTFFVVAVAGMAWALTALAARLAPVVAGWLAVALGAGILGCCWFIARMTREQPEKLVYEHAQRERELLATQMGPPMRDLMLELLDEYGLLPSRMEGEPKAVEETADA